MRFKYRKLIVTATCSVMLLGMLVFTTRNSLDEGLVTGATSQTSGGAVVASGSSTAVATGAGTTASGELKTGSDLSTTSSSEIVGEGGANAKGVSILMKNAYPEINKMVETYLKARLRADKEKITECVDDINYAGIERLPEMTKDMESIELIDCYTIDGPEEKALMVYARNKVKIKGIDTAASGIDGFYIRPDSNGDMKIVLSPLDDEVQKIIDEDINRDDVISLLKDVNTELAREIKSDKKLAKFFKKLQKKNEATENSQP